MPTYMCYSRIGLLSRDQRSRIAKSLTEIHHEIAIAPRYFVQVIFNELTLHSHYIAGAEAQEGHIWIRADIRAGRTQEQKTGLITRIVDEVSKLGRVPKEDVWVYISDIPGQSVAEFGQTLPAPGGEAEWFAKIPHDLQQRLRTLAERAAN